MREWTGRRDDLSDTAEEGLKTAQNVSFKMSGEMRRRPGLGGRIDRSGILTTEWSDPFGVAYVVVVGDTGAIYTIRLSTSASTAVKTGLNTANRGCFARSNGRLYFVNDFDAMQRVTDGTQATDT